LFFGEGTTIFRGKITIMSAMHSVFPAAPQTKNFYRFTVVFLSLLGLGACQTDGVSLKDAKKISIELEKVTVQAPPRTVDDIVDLLNSRPPEFLTEYQSFLKVFNAPIQNSAPGEERLAELEAKANAAVQLGRTQSAIKLWQQVVDEANASKEEISVVRRGSWVWNLADAYLSGGDVAKSYKTIQDAAQIFRSGKTQNPFVEGPRLGRLAALEAVLATRLLQFGDIKKARQALDNSKQANNGFKAILDLARRNGVPLEADTLQAISMAKALVLFGKGEEVRLSGNLRQAEQMYREARDILKLDDVAVEGFSSKTQKEAWQLITARLASLLKDQGRFVEAEGEARSAVRNAFETRGPIGTQTIDMLLSLNEILLSQRRFTDTNALLESASRMLQESSTNEESWYAFRTNQQQAVGMAGTGQWKEAATIYLNLENTPSYKRGYIAANMESDPSRAIIYLSANETRLALSAAQQESAWASRVYPSGHFSIAESRGVEAAALLRSGQPEKARSILNSILPTLIDAKKQRQISFRENPFRRERLQAAFETFIKLIGDRPNAEDIGKAFQLAQIVRKSSIISAVAASALRSSVTDSDLADLIRREQDALKFTSALYTQRQNVLSLPKAQQNPKQLEAMQEQIRTARLTRETLAREIEAQFPDYQEKSAPGAISISALQKILRDDESFILIQSSDSASYVWAVAARGQARFAKSSYGREDIEENVIDLRIALAPGGVSQIGDIPEFDVASAYNLYRELLLPVSAAWKQSRAIVAVTDGQLNSLPLGVLPTEATVMDAPETTLFENYKKVPWLINSHEIAQVPTVSTFTILRSAQYEAPELAFIGFGDPVFNKNAANAGGTGGTRGTGFSLRAVPSTVSMRNADIGMLPQLPDTKTEIMKIAAVMNVDVDRDVYLGSRASEQVVQDLNAANVLAKYKVISFATHGLRAGELDGLTEPALALSNPGLSNEKNDGFLTMSEIFKLKLNAQIAVLSACNTASGEFDNAEAVSGLGRAFFYAGAHSLLVSNWPVFSASTTELMINLFSDPTLSLRTAYQQAMINLIKKGTHKTSEGKVAFSYAHPLFWAPFTFVGDVGGVQ
jgi:CHAT domain-containing protein